MDIASLFEHDGLAVGAGELDVEVREFGDLFRLAGLGVVDKEVHSHVTVGNEEDFVADPHGEDVLGVVFGDIGDALLGRIPDPDVVCHAAAVVLPGAEFTHHAVVGQPLAVGRPAAEAPFREGNLFGHAALGGYGPEFAGEAVAYAVAVDYLLAVAAPCHHHVVGAHTVAHVVTRVGGCVGEPYRFAALRGHQVNLAVAVVLGCEGYAAAVGGVAGESFVSQVGRQPAGLSSAYGYPPEVSGVSEYYFTSVCGGKTHQAGFLAGAGTGQADYCHESGQQ